MKNLSIDSKKIKLLAIMIAVFLGVEVIAPQVFLANSPRISPIFIARLKNTPAYFASLPGNLIASLNPFGKKLSSPTAEIFSQIPKVNPPAGIIFQSVAKGVKAAEDKKTNTIYFTVEKGTQFKVIETEITQSDGTKKKIKLLIPIE